MNLRQMGISRSAHLFLTLGRALTGRRSPEAPAVHDELSVTVPANTCLAIHGGANCAVQVQSGEVRIVSQSDADDFVLGAGERCPLRSNGKTLIGASSESRIAIAADGESRDLAFQLRRGSASRLLRIVAKASARSRFDQWLAVAA
jgi:hypothetical protein